VLMAVLIHGAFCYVWQVHQYLGAEAMKLYMNNTGDPDFLRKFSNSTPQYNKVKNGLRNEDMNDWTYGCGESDGFNINVQDFQNNLEEWVCNLIGDTGNNPKSTFSHSWDSSNQDPSQVTNHMKLLGGLRENDSIVWFNPSVIGPGPTTLTKAERTILGMRQPDDIQTLYVTHDYYVSTPTLMAQTIDSVTGVPGNVDTFTHNAIDGNKYIFHYKIRSLDDFLIHQNIVLLQQSNVLVHLSDEQFMELYVSEQFPGYEYLGRLCHLLMDMAVPTHAHNDVHGPSIVFQTLPTYGDLTSLLFQLLWDYVIHPNDNVIRNNLIQFILDFQPQLIPEDSDFYEGWGPITVDFVNLGFPELADYDGVQYPQGGFLSDPSSLENVWNVNTIINSFGSTFIPLPTNTMNGYSEDFIYDLFFTVNQITQMFASEDVDGSGPVDGRYSLSRYPYIQNMCDLISAEIAVNPSLANHLGVRNNDYGTMPTIRDYCIPLAIRGTATLIDWWEKRYARDIITVKGSIENYTSGLENASVQLNSYTSVIGISDVNAEGEFAFDIPVFAQSYQTMASLFIDVEGYHPINVSSISISYPENYSGNYERNIGSFILEPLNSTTGLHVNRDGSNSSFSSIMEAVNYALQNEIDIVTIWPGTYSEKIEFNVPDTADINSRNFEIRGRYANGSTILNRPPYQDTNYIIVRNTTDNHGFKNLIFKNLVLNGFYGDSIDAPRGFLIGQNCANNVLLQNCEIKNFVDPRVTAGGIRDGVAVLSLSNTTLNGCSILNNSGSPGLESSLDSGSRGVISISGNSTITNCDIRNNKSRYGAIYIYTLNQYDSYDVEISGNYFENNTSHTPVNSPGFDIYAHCCYPILDQSITCVIKNNIFTRSYGTTNGAVVNLTRIHDAKLSNNTFINNHSNPTVHLRAIELNELTGSEQRQGLEQYETYNTFIKNNVFSSYNTAVFDNILDNESSVSFGRNLFWNNAVAFQENGQATVPSNSLFEDPLLGENYIPIWNSSAISPCIDSGIGDLDPDGTPPDIGAKKVQNHKYWDYTFENQNDVDKWYWVSYPVLNSITDNALLASEFFKELLTIHLDSDDNPTPSYLDEIRWYNHEGEYSIFWNDSSWCGTASSHIVTSPQGYKVKLQSRINPNFSWPITLVESGLKTPDSMQFPIYGGMENWLGYFKENAANPRDAFRAIWDDITMIRTKSWCILRDANSGELVGKSGPISFGDMVIVTTYNDHNFQWGNASPDIISIKKISDRFVFDEKPDYIPVYISLPDSLVGTVTEVGIYVNGACKGAVVVDDSFEQISTYVDSAEELIHGDVQLAFCYEDSKHAGNQLQTMLLQPNQLQARQNRAGYPYFEVKLTQDDLQSVIPPEFALMQNYPNPFNPSTTIAFSLPEESLVRLDIFNIKGQLVKNLLDSEMPMGLHSVVWNGRDMNNMAVSSGVYFYRISSFKNTITNKMLLMK